MQPTPKTERQTLQAIDIEGVSYFLAADVLRDVGVSRQTLWRWRADGKVPQGHVRSRDKQVLFTAAEVDQIREFAHRIEPAVGPTTDQLRLFSTRKQGT